MTQEMTQILVWHMNDIHVRMTHVQKMTCMFVWHMYRKWHKCLYDTCTENDKCKYATRNDIDAGMTQEMT